jgi:hypothetical protein
MAASATRSFCRTELVQAVETGPGIDPLLSLPLNIHRQQPGAGSRLTAQKWQRYGETKSVNHAGPVVASIENGVLHH